MAKIITDKKQILANKSKYTFGNPFAKAVRDANVGQTQETTVKGFSESTYTRDGKTEIAIYGVGQGNQRFRLTEEATDTLNIGSKVTVKCQEFDTPEGGKRKYFELDSIDSVEAEVKAPAKSRVK